MDASAVMHWVERIFGGDAPIEPLHFYQVAARAAVVYVIGMVIVRIGKSRLIGRATSLDVLLGFILGSLLSRGITGHASISATTISSATIVAVHYGLTRAAMTGGGWENLLKGHSRVIIKDGEVVEKNLQISHLSHDDLAEQLRLSGVESVADVKLAYKERSGGISVIQRQG